MKFTDEGGVEVRIKDATDGGARVDVADTGAGIPDDCRQTIFTPFRRGGDIRTHTTGGAGIGLPLAQRIAWRHGGEICAVTTGAGSVFALEIPADRVLQAA